MLGKSTTTVMDGGAAVPETTNRHDGLTGGGGAADENNNSNCGEDEKGRSGGRGDDGGGNRWPRQETLALLKLRSELDVAFRDASVKGPLWEQISRKLREVGYHRSAKKCKEKFENVYKYHKRTKDVRSGKSHNTKSYKFFEQLQALEIHPPPPTTTAAPSPTTVAPSTTAAAVPYFMNISFSQPNPTIHIPSTPPPLPTNNPTSFTKTVGMEFQSIEADLVSNSVSDDVDELTSSDDNSRKRKRKWKDFFERLTREVIQKQEEMQKRFLETIEKREQERVEREEAWRMQEMIKINRERDILAQERSMAAAKDAAITSILQKVTELPHRNNNNNNSSQLLPLPQQQQQQQPQQQISMSNPIPVVQPPPSNIELMQMESTKTNPNGVENYKMSPSLSSSRWPKVEIEALINLRTNLEIKYHENGPKGPLWEEISLAMKRIGYNRNAKRCKEKWENINKYFKKVKENKKTRHEDSKTCPYFHHLDALYKMKNNSNPLNNNVVIGSSMPIIPHRQQPLIVQPEQQWPPQQEIVQPVSGNEEMEINESIDRADDKDDEDENEDEVEEDEGSMSNYEIVASKPPSMSAIL